MRGVIASLACGAVAFAPSGGPRGRFAARATCSMMASPPTLKIGIFGGGTVGGGIVEILESRRAQLSAAANGASLEVTTVVVRDAGKERDWTLPPGCVVTEDYEAVLADPSIDLVVEVMGGTTLAKDVVFRALRAGKDVVTANKALIASSLLEIEAVLAEVNAGFLAEGRREVQFGFEAAVCGGIPIIHTLQTAFVGDEITRLRGIMNGCTNFMLTKMEGEGLSYADVLAEASALGYAEEDPTLDVGGFDARSKLAILVRLGFGVDVAEDDISCKGIEKLKTIDFEYARENLGGTIKLLGVASTDAEGRLTAYVSPAFVPQAATLASIGDATNAIEIASSNLQATLLVGRGAGRFPTANSCVTDILACATRRMAEPFARKAPDVPFNPDFEAAFYLRVRFGNTIGIIRQLGEICERNGVSIDSLLQKQNSDYFAIITELAPHSLVTLVAKEIEATTWCDGDVFFMPVATVH